MRHLALTIITAFTLVGVTACDATYAPDDAMSSSSSSGSDSSDAMQDDVMRSATAPCEPGLQLELDPATGEPAANPDGTLVVKYHDAQGGECYEQLECCDVVTLGCFCADTEHGAKCPSGSINPNAPSNGG